MPPLDFGSQKQLFIDDVVIDEAVGVRRNLNQPAKYVGNPVMIPLYPWEGRLELFGTVRRDPDGSFRMWYQGMGGMGVAHMGLDLTGTHLEDLKFDLKNLQYSICYATSHDGIHWDRPNLGLVEHNGTTDNNIVISNAAFANVIEDTRDRDPNRRYKSLFFEDQDWEALGSPHIDQGVSVAFSPDGLRWTKHPDNPVITKSSDSHTLLGWDDLHGCYVAYARPTMREGNNTRRIGRCVSDDFVNWTDPEDVLAPDEHDPPAMEFYGMPVCLTYSMRGPKSQSSATSAPLTSSSLPVETASAGSEPAIGSRSSPTARREASTPARYSSLAVPWRWTTSCGSTTRPAPWSTASPGAAGRFAWPSCVETASSRWTPATMPARWSPRRSVATEVH